MATRAARVRTLCSRSLRESFTRGRAPPLLVTGRRRRRLHTTRTRLVRPRRPPRQHPCPREAQPILARRVEYRQDERTMLVLRERLLETCLCRDMCHPARLGPAVPNCDLTARLPFKLTRAD